MPDLFARPNPAGQRAERSYDALKHLVERHADSDGRRSRHLHPSMAAPHEVVRLVAGMAGGSIVREPGESEIDGDDLVAALTLVPELRADLDAIETQLLRTARAKGMTWQDIAFSLGLNTPQAARQRYERLEARSGDVDASGPS